MKHQIAEEAARLLAEQGVLDYGWARRKAAQRLGFSKERDLPDLAAIEEAFLNYQQLFRPQDSECIAQQRQSAINLMTLFEAFTPRLAGPLARGISAPEAEVLIYLYADSPKEVAFILLDEKLDWQGDDITIEKGVSTPLFHVAFEDGHFRLQVLPMSFLRQPPVDEVTGKREPGLSLKQLREEYGQAQALG